MRRPCVFGGVVAPARHGHPGARVIRKLLLSLCSLAVALAIVEATLRVTHAFNARLAWTEPDPLIGYRFTPGREYWFSGENDHAITGRINSLGWRDRERSRARPAGAFRVAVLGDSYVEAFQVELDSTFGALAERALSTRDSTVEVMNFGRSGMTTTEELLVLERDILPCNPNVVVLVFVPRNDITDVNPATADHDLQPFFRLDDRDSLRLDTSFSTRGAYRNRERINALKQRSALVSLAAERYNAWRRSHETSTRGAARLTPELSLCTASPDSLFMRNFAMNMRLIARCADTCRARGVGFVLMSVPLEYEDAAVGELRALDASFDPEWFDRELRALANANGAGFVALTERFARRHRETGEALQWAHWNYAGHRLAAEALVDGLSTRPHSPDN